MPPSVLGRPGVFADIPQVSSAAGSNEAFGASAAMSPIPFQSDQKNLIASLVYNLDRLTNPETPTNPATYVGVRRHEEIWAYVARYFDNYHVALFPGAAGKPLPHGIKALGDRRRPLYDAIDIQTGFNNRQRIGASAMVWGGRPTDPEAHCPNPPFCPF